MIYYVKGILTEYTEDGVVIEAGGIGYQITVPTSLLAELPQPGEEVQAGRYACAIPVDIAVKARFCGRFGRSRRFGRLGRLFARLHNGDALRLGIRILIVDAGEIDGRNPRLNRASSRRTSPSEDLSVSLRRADGKEKRRCKVD